MRDFLLWCLTLFDHIVIVYFVVLNSILLLLMVVAAWAVAQAGTRMTATEADEIFASPFTPGISMIVPAFNEQVLIVESVRSMLDLKYPDLEVVIVDDGSTDGTFAELRDAFDLEPAEYVLADDVPHIGEVLSAHRSRRGDPLVVIRKANTGRRSDAINVGINATRKPLIGITDADSVMDESALLHMVQPFLEDPERMVAVGGTIRVVNGTTVAGGRVQSPSQPRTWLARIQVLEYLRSFLLGRVAWSKMNGLLIVSGAFGLFRRDVVVSADGLDLDSLAEDAELVTRLHRDLRREGVDYRIGFTSEPVCWTEAPGTASQLRRQRRRWSRGLAELLWTHRSMIGNPRYGRIGLIVIPYYLLFELLGAVVEVTGFFVVLVGLGLGVVDIKFMLLFMVAAWVYGLLVSAATLAIEEFSYHRYERWGDLGISVLASVGEAVFYRPLHAVWRLEGLIAAIRKTESSWDPLQRTGFDSQEDSSKASVS
ncbi:MAG: glycosyltransferase family 2 protein [Actinomycetia bacterium]|nr:glycosyltransferase family 2 protein [Actinomycetes bacterium]